MEITLWVVVTFVLFFRALSGTKLGERVKNIRVSVILTRREKKEGKKGKKLSHCGNCAAWFGNNAGKEGDYSLKCFSPSEFFSVYIFNCVVL